MRRAVFAVTALAAWLAVAGAYAQQTAAPAPILRVTVDPPRVVVGQRTTLRVEVLAPNYMTSPPVLPDFQVRNAVTRQLPSLNQSEQHDGMTYAGVRFEFAIYPQEPGSYAIPDQKITVKYADEPPKTRATTLALPRIEFQAFIPEAAVSLEPFVAATSLAIEQVARRSSDELKVGDAVTRIITVKADGVPAMLLPPVKFARADGMALYPAQPSLQDRTDARTDAFSATRVDQATYMLERPGDYVLPAIDISWWNVGTQKVERSHASEVMLSVVGSSVPPSARQGERQSTWEGLLDLIVTHWLFVALTLVLLCALAWASPQAARAIAVWYWKRRDAYRASEAWSYRRLRIAVRHHDAGEVYCALLDWLDRFNSIAPIHTIDFFKRAARDPVLGTQIDAVEKRLFGPQGVSANWSANKLRRGLGSARGRLRRQIRQARGPYVLPQKLNPVTAAGPPRPPRRIAR